MSRKDVEVIVIALLEKAKNASTSLEALQYTQAACNTANTFSCISHTVDKN